MIRFSRGGPLVPVVLVAAAVAVVLAAALTSWWVLLALIPLLMMIGCVAMMGAHRRMQWGATGARCACCPAGAPAGAPPDREQEGASSALVPGGER